MIMSAGLCCCLNIQITLFEVEACLREDISLMTIVLTLPEPPYHIDPPNDSPL